MTTSEIAPKIAPYGSWKSPITSDLIVAQSTPLSEVRSDGDYVYWLEGRPQERGRSVIMRAGADGAATNITPAPTLPRWSLGHRRTPQRGRVRRAGPSPARDWVA